MADSAQQQQQQQQTPEQVQSERNKARKLAVVFGVLSGLALLALILVQKLVKVKSEAELMQMQSLDTQGNPKTLLTGVLLLALLIFMVFFAVYLNKSSK